MGLLAYKYRIGKIIFPIRPTDTIKLAPFHAEGLVPRFPENIKAFVIRCAVTILQTIMENQCCTIALMKPLILKRIQEKPQRKIIPGNRDFNFRALGSAFQSEFSCSN